MKKRNGLVGFAGLVALALLLVVFRDRLHFDWGNFWSQLRHVRWLDIAAGTALIWGTFLLRAVRWSILIRPMKKVSASRLVGAQFIGFTAVALFGRLADLTRPYLLAKKAELSVASQVAVYTIERMFDLGAAAIIFSAALALTGRDLPHHEIFVRTGIVSLGATLALAVFAFVVKASGGVLAAFARGTLGRLSRPLGESVANKLLGFREGLNALSTLVEVGVCTGISLLMWGMIGEAYVQTAHAFVQTPELAGLTFSRTMLLMGASMGSSLLQLPVIGWFTQIGLTATAMHQFYGAPVEAAAACGALLLMVTSLSIVPLGLIFAHVEGVSLKAAAKQSEVAVATLPPGVPEVDALQAVPQSAGDQTPAARIDSSQ